MSGKTSKGEKKAAVPKKAVTKTEKKAVEKKEKKEKKEAPGESVGFVYGGTMKASYGYSFCAQVSSPEEVKTYAKEHFAEFYGADISGRFVKCENGEEALEKFLEHADEKKYRVGTEGKLLFASVNNLAALLKEVTDSASAHKFSMEEKKKETKKKAKDSGDQEEGEDDAEDENVEDDAEDDDAEDDEEDGEEEDEEGEEDEDEDDKQVKKPAKKAAAPAKKAVPAKKPAAPAKKPATKTAKKSGD